MSTALKLKGSSVARLAAEEGVSPRAIYAAFVESSSHLQLAIAAAVGVEPQVLFPEFYRADGQRKGWTCKPNRNRNRREGHVQKNAAA